MSTSSTLEEKRAEGPMERPEGHTSINIAIHQESSLAYLAKAVGQCWAGRQAAAAPKKPGPRAPASAATVSVGKSCGSGEEKALGGAQILLGVVCISLGVLVQQERFFYERLWSGAPFWMGGLFIASGTSAVVSGRRGGSHWVYLALVSHLASIVAGCVALTQGVARIPALSSSYSLRKELCESQQPWPATASYGWRESQCKSTLWSLLTIAFATRILLLIFSVAALGIALFCLLALCCRLRAKNKNYAVVGDPEVPPPYEDAARTENIA